MELKIRTPLKAIMFRSTQGLIKMIMKLTLSFEKSPDSVKTKILRDP